MESQITVSRTSPDDVQLRQIIVKLNGERIAELMYGQSVTRAMAPGHHQLRVDNTWNWKTVEFDLAPGEVLKFRTVSRAPDDLRGFWSARSAPARCTFPSSEKRRRCSRVEGQQGYVILSKVPVLARVE